MPIPVLSKNDACVPHQQTTFFILAGIQLIELSRQKPVLSLDRRAQKPEHLLYERLLSLLRGQLRQLKSRQPFVPAGLELLNDSAQSGTSLTRWAKYK